ncbi:MAG: DUF4430 domain-containing protein [Ruminococcaceae bacterium]|nr:DUF4430 domain-containing protein [Oscillospiraceae bacterium]
MKKTIRIFLVLICVAALFVGCNKGPVYVDGTARYTEDTTLGNGSKTITVTVKDNEGKAVVFTIRTDAKTVGDALIENELIAGDEGAYGMYIKVVNGLRADYDKDHAYWGFNVDGEASMTGVDMTDLVDGGVYELVYTIG